MGMNSYFLAVALNSFTVGAGNVEAERVLPDDELMELVGHLNSQLGPVLPTLVPSGQTMASAVHAVGCCEAQPAIKITEINKIGITNLFMNTTKDLNITVK